MSDYDSDSSDVSDDARIAEIQREMDDRIERKRARKRELRARDKIISYHFKTLFLISQDPSEAQSFLTR